MSKIIEFQTRNWGPFWVDACDADHVRAAWGWGFNGHHVVGPNDGSTRLLHRQLVKAPKGKVVDHQDGNGRNCTRANLRIGTKQQNSWNRNRSTVRHDFGSRFVGVIRNGPGGIALPWRAMIMNGGKTTQLGTYRSEVVAAEAYDKACLNLRGEFAWLNFPPAGWVQSGRSLPGPWDDWLALELRREARLLGVGRNETEGDV